MRVCGLIMPLIYIRGAFRPLGAVLNRAIVVERCCKTPRFDFATVTISPFPVYGSRPCPCSLVCCEEFLSSNVFYVTVI